MQFEGLCRSRDPMKIAYMCWDRGGVGRSKKHTWFKMQRSCVYHNQCCFVCLILSSQGFILYPSIPCRPDWPGTHREPPASASCMLEFSVHPYTWRLFQAYFLIVVCRGFRPTTLQYYAVVTKSDTVRRSFFLSFIQHLHASLSLLC